MASFRVWAHVLVWLVCFSLLFDYDFDLGPIMLYTCGCVGIFVIRLPIVSGPMLVFLKSATSSRPMANAQSDIPCDGFLDQGLQVSCRGGCGASISLDCRHGPSVAAYPIAAPVTFGVFDHPTLTIAPACHVTATESNARIEVDAEPEPFKLDAFPQDTVLKKSDSKMEPDDQHDDTWVGCNRSGCGNQGPHQVGYNVFKL